MTGSSTTSLAVKVASDPEHERHRSNLREFSGTLAGPPPLSVRSLRLASAGRAAGIRL